MKEEEDTVNLPNESPAPKPMPPTKSLGRTKLIKRIEKEYNDVMIHNFPNITIHKYLLNPFMWHFVYTGSKGTPLDGGEYHGDIFFEGKFPHAPPTVILNTYNGRILRGQEVSLISPRWWNSSMRMVQIIEVLRNIFENAVPRPNGVLFEETYRLRILAERSQFTGCAFCHKKERLNPNDKEFVDAATRWQKLEKDTTGESFGQWWNELREIVIKGEEYDIKEMESRNYECCLEKFYGIFNSYLILLNWKYIAQHAIAPIVYRFILMGELVTCLAFAIILAKTKDFDLEIRVPAIIDCIAMFFIGLQECGAVYSFILTRQLRGPLRSLSRFISIIGIISIITHIVCAIIIASFIFDDKYDKYKAEGIVYVVTAFGNDFYHYLMGILFYLNAMFYYTASLLVYIFTCKLCKRGIKYKAIPYKCPDNRDDSKQIAPVIGETRINIITCNVCLEQIRPGESAYQLECDETHIFHQDCLQSITFNGEYKCPMCRKLIDFPNEIPPKAKENAV